MCHLFKSQIMAVIDKIKANTLLNLCQQLFANCHIGPWLLLLEDLACYKTLSQAFIKEYHSGRM